MSVPSFRVQARLGFRWAFVWMFGGSCVVGSGTGRVHAATSSTEGWFKERIAEQLAPRQALDAEAADVAAASGRLWRERPPGGAPIPEFVPPSSLAPLIRSVSAGVVNISALQGEKAASGVARRALGSGFLISPDGDVVTNNHVVERAQRILVQLADGREFEAQVTGRDSSTDLALLKLDWPSAEPLPFVYLGDSDALEVGDWVLAIGNPFGLDHSVSHGMISAKERVLGVGVFDDFLQTDALINPGNSGGPLFNMRGEVVGVNTAVISQGQGIGFAVPIALVKDLLPNLRVNGHLARGWLGVHILEQRSGGTSGATVKEVFADSPAAKSGIQPGDRVVAVNGRAIDSYLQLLRRVSVLPPGSDVRLAVVRASEHREVSVRLSERPAADALKPLPLELSEAQELGLVVQEVTGKETVRSGAAPSVRVAIASVLPGSAAERAGLLGGDVVLEVNRHPVTHLEAYRTALARSPRGMPVLFRIRRGGAIRYVALRP